MTDQQASNQNPPTGAARNVPISERLMFATVRLEMPELSGRTGTGFFYIFYQHGDNSVPAIITNKHVIEGADTLHFRLTKAGHDNLPLIGQTVSVKINELRKRIVLHPDADLAAIMLGDILKLLVERGETPYFAPLIQSMIPTETEMRELVPLEAIITVGYPGQLWDDINNLPLFHRGSTATAPYIDFRGKKEFLVDFATWPGASGSPVFILNEGAIFNARTGNSYIGSSRLLFIGVVYGVAVQEVTGQVVIEQAPTQFAPTALRSSSKVPTNLGACLRASHVIELEQQLFNLGIVAPAGYVSRGSA